MGGIGRGELEELAPSSLTGAAACWDELFWPWRAEPAASMEYGGMLKLEEWEGGSLGRGELEELAPSSLTGAAACWDELFWPWRAEPAASMEYGGMLKLEEWEGGSLGRGELEELAPSSLTGAGASWDELFWPWRAEPAASLEYGGMLKIEEWEGGSLGRGELEELAPSSLTGAGASWDELFWPWRAEPAASLEYGGMLKIEEWEGGSVGLD